MTSSYGAKVSACFQMMPVMSFKLNGRKLCFQNLVFWLNTVLDFRKTKLYRRFVDCISYACILFCPPSLPEYFVVPSSLADQDLKLYSHSFAGRRMPVSMRQDVAANIGRVSAGPAHIASSGDAGEVRHAPHWSFSLIVWLHPNSFPLSHL